MNTAARNATILRAIDLAVAMHREALEARRRLLTADDAATLIQAARALADAHRAATVGECSDELVRAASRCWRRTHARIIRRNRITGGNVAALDFDFALASTKVRARLRMAA